MRKDNEVVGRVRIIAFVICLTMIFAYMTLGCSGEQSDRKGDDAVRVEVRVPPIRVETRVKTRVKTERFEFKEDFRDQMEVGDINDINKALFFVDVGDLHVSYHDSNMVVIKVDYHVEALSEKDLATIIEETEISANANGDTLELTINKKDCNESIWEWADKNISTYSISADVAVSVPKTFQYFDLKTDTGGIEIDGLEGVFVLKADTGSITAKSIRFAETSSIAVDTGSVNLFLDKGEEVNKSDIEIYADTGSITIDVGNLPYKDVSSAISNKTIIVSDKCRINASVDTGTVRLK